MSYFAERYQSIIFVYYMYILYKYKEFLFQITKILQLLNITRPFVR